MKNTLILTSIFLIAFISCKKKDSAEPTPAPSAAAPTVSGSLQTEITQNQNNITSIDLDKNKVKFFIDCIKSM